MEACRRVLLSVLVIGMLAASGCAKAATLVAGEPRSEPTRDFGVSVDPWHIDEWAAAVGATPTMVMEFEAFSRNRVIDNHFAEVRRQGVPSFMLTWEPWRTVSAARGKAAQYAVQPEYSNAAIVAGQQDAYITAFARSVAASGLTVYIRYAHEMNGDWYPWSRDPANYVRAWRHVVDIFRAEGATNARFVFSVNPSVFEPAASWQANLRRYWPGDEYVDLVGATMISFGGRKDYTVREFVDRFVLTRQMFHKPLIITELNTAAQGRVEWLADLRTWLATEGTSWVQGVVLSQGESRGATQLGGKVGDLRWDITTDAETQPVIRGMITDLRATPAVDLSSG